MRFESFVAARYLRAKRRTRFVSLITIISVLGVSVGVIALIVVMAVMTGFDIMLVDTIIGNRAHLTVQAPAGWPIQDWRGTMEEIETLCPEVEAAGPVVQIEALLKKGRSTTGAFILGVDPELESEVTNLAENLTRNDKRTFGRGELPGEKEIVLGYRLAHRLGVSIGSTLQVITANSTVRPFMGQQLGSRVFLTVSGIAQAKMSEFDTVYGFVDLATARMLSGEEGVDGINLRLQDPMQADMVKQRIHDELALRGVTWYENNESFLAALKQEKLAMFIILTFIILVAAFNITSTLIMIVMEKRQDIGILRTIGVSGPTILRIFMLQGLLIGLGGTLVGLVAGTALAYNLNEVVDYIGGLLGLDIFPDTIYYFDRIPVAVMPGDVALITVSAVVLTFLSTIYPAISAVMVNPVDALRNE